MLDCICESNVGSRLVVCMLDPVWFPMLVCFARFPILLFLLCERNFDSFWHSFRVLGQGPFAEFSDYLGFHFECLELPFGSLLGAQRVHFEGPGLSSGSILGAF